MKLLVSACLLGDVCRYDGKSKPCEAVLRLKESHTLIPICPEVMGGLPIPRIPSEVQKDGTVRNREGQDVTCQYQAGAREVLRIAQDEHCDGAILKEKSPACGKGRIYDGSFTKTLTAGNGICADLLLQNGFTVVGESEISDEILLKMKKI
ncbi:MAG: DUF523 domain-containing protein [Clostridia bacterium]|nr:DUF523 domain-containing protein [Clostridia bacterium]